MIDLVFVSMTCFQLQHLGMEKNARQYRVLHPFALHPLFDHVITGSYKNGLRSRLRVRDICLQPLQPEFFYSRKSEEKSRICSMSTIGRFFLSSMQQTLLQERPPRETHESAPAVLHGDSVACATDATVGLPSLPPKKHGETPVCDVCAKTFATHKMLKRHRETVHRQSGGFSCQVCDQRFCRRDHLKKHHIREHADEEYEASASHTCPICQKRFYYRGHLRKHLKTHPATTSPPPSPASLLASPASAFHAERRACPVHLPVSILEDCRQCYSRFSPVM